MTHGTPKLAALVLVVAAAAAGCGASNNLPICPVPIQPIGLSMLYPSPGATGVPDNLSGIYLKGNGAAGSTDLSLASGAQSSPLGALETPPPSSPTPSPLMGEWYAAITAPLAAATTYSVMQTNTISGSDCTPRTEVESLGSFTTQ